MKSTDRSPETTSDLDLLSRRIPAFRGYANKPGRRESAEALQAHLLDALTAQRNRLAHLEMKLSAGKKLAATAQVDRALTRIQLFVEDLRSITFAQGLWLEAVALPGDDLLYLYHGEAALFAGVDAVSRGVDEIARALDAGEPPAAGVGDLVDVIEILTERLARRHQAARNLGK